MPGKVLLRLVLLRERAAFAALPVTAQDDGGANTLDDKLIFAILSDHVVVDGLTLCVYHVHGSSLPFSLS